MNIWRTDYRSRGAVFWFMIVFAVNFVAFGLSVIRLVQYLRDRGIAVTVATIALTLDTVGFFMASLYWGLDPWCTCVLSWFPHVTNSL